MGNTNATSSSKRDRTYSVDSAYDRRESSSPRGEDTRTFEFVAGGRKKPVLCYQSSNEYSNEDSNDDYKVGSVWWSLGWRILGDTIVSRAHNRQQLNWIKLAR